MKNNAQKSFPFGLSIEKLKSELDDDEVTVNTRSELFLSHLAVLHSNVNEIQASVNILSKNLDAHIRLEEVNCNSVVELEQQVKLINANIKGILNILGEIRIGEQKQDIDMQMIRDAIKPQLSASSNKTLGFAGIISVVIPIALEILKSIIGK